MIRPTREEFLRLAQRWRRVPVVLELTADTVTPTGMLLRLARAGGRDAVFDVPAAVIRNAPPDPEILVQLADEPTIRAVGRVREVSPEADPEGIISGCPIN